MFRKLCGIVLYSFAFSCGPANPYASGPSDQELKRSFAIKLPAYVRLKSFKVQASANVGNKVEPDFRGRFRASVVLENNTYVEESRNGDDVYVRSQLDAGDIKELFGTADSTMKAGSWQTAFTFEEDLLRTIGKPRDLFIARRVCLVDFIPDGSLLCVEVEPEGR